MSGKWLILLVVLSLATTILNLTILTGKTLTAASARAGTNAGRLLEDEDFTDGLTKIIRKTVRDYCTVGKRNGIDC